MNDWKSTPPDAPGLYVASTERCADSIRFWTGKHWTAPRKTYDLDRVPGSGDAPAAPEGPIEWLEPVTIDERGFVSWGGAQRAAPMRRTYRVEVRFRNGTTYCSNDPQGLDWTGNGVGTEIAAYRVLPSAALARANAAKANSGSYCHG